MIAGILLGIAGVVAVPLTVALFIKKEYVIAREIVIDKPQSQVFDYLRHLRNQDKFSKWVMQDPNKKTAFRGTDGHAGFVYSWESKGKNAGKGEQEIICLSENKNIDIEIRFEKPFKNIARTPFTIEALSDNKTKVRWEMIGRNAYPMNLMTLFLGGMLGKDMETSLHNLKTILEQK